MDPVGGGRHGTWPCGKPCRCVSPASASRVTKRILSLFGRAAWRSPLHTSARRGGQYLGRPASSAGVERMFSKAGKLYGDDKKGEEDGTLEAMLFAAANTE